MGVEPGTPVEYLAAAVGDLTYDAVATVDRRMGEPAIDAVAAGRKLLVFTTAELDVVHVPNPSAVVRRLTGTGSVAEAAAILGARELGGVGELVVEKQRGRMVTVALAH